MTTSGVGPPQPADSQSPGTDDTHADAATIALARARRERPSPSRTTTRRRTRRGGEPTFSGSAPDERDPQSLSDSVDTLTQVAGWRSRLAVAGLTVRWAEVVGADVARHSRLAGFDTRTGDVLVIADSPAWASALRMCTATILARIGEEAGEGVVTTLTIRSGRLDGSAASYPPTSGR